MKYSVNISNAFTVFHSLPVPIEYTIRCVCDAMFISLLTTMKYLDILFIIMTMKIFVKNRGF